MTGPKWQAIAADIARRIRTGESPIGSTIPSYRDLPVNYKASLGTVKRAVEYLQEVGILQAVHGKGLFVVRVPKGELDFTPSPPEDLSLRVERVEKAIEDLQRSDAEQRETASRLEMMILDVYSRAGLENPFDENRGATERKPRRRRAAG